MPPLRWSRRGRIWRAGRYDIELAAPGLWVCSRRPRRSGRTAVIEQTSGSLSSLKARIEQMDRRRTMVRRSVSYGAAAVVLLGLSIWTSSVGGGLGALAGLLSGSLGAMCVLRSIDGIVRRSWEALTLHYQ